MEKRKEENEKNGSKKSEFDFLDHLISGKDAFPTTLDVVDEIGDFFTAASITSQVGSIIVLSHLIKNSQNLARVRAEFEKFKDD